MSNTTRFVSNQRRQVEFDKMIQNISKDAQISYTLAQKYTELAICAWESSEKRSVNTLVNENVEARTEQISKMLDYLRTYIKPLINSEKHLDHALIDASIALEDIYKI
ncbi:hypothetical protein NEF87_001305 [Candidatus Lokiarchaeum ossiferum]|uniref:Uncharacterized protein n=1 Tax=Candidatus Lokiarchaeum ossiferum TaxID=2951803 RepID=A0ABY6HNN9_9ARCH|nr:hypothetical protein NEF87_001305 [Candidatus Lokiarchaeum sp. B-35]